MILNFVLNTMISAQKIHSRNIYQYVKRIKPIHWSKIYETRDTENNSVIPFKPQYLYKSLSELVCMPDDELQKTHRKRVDNLNNFETKPDNPQIPHLNS